MSQERQPGPDPEAPTGDTRTLPVQVFPPEPSPALKSIGHYHIKQVIASGGMGTVYLAVQEHPRRTVALKVMRRGIASRSAMRRFEFESQILARLKHPCIAEVYDAGTHDDGTGGVPYFAMEYIPNARTITEYAKASALTTRQRLELFAKVCEGVHHGHQKGIIHRDLKPGNILVDAEGRPKIIDFGVARATDSDLAITTLQTDIGQLIGTLQYMSPEQCEADPHDIDTRSDVYALGVVLYELLCGQLPYDVSRLAIHEAARVIREQAPARPSTINRTLRGDVETITQKAMEKDRWRRYRSAIDLGDDIHRYLRSEPIQARPPSAMYQFRRFVNRNRTLVSAIAVVFVVLAGGIVGTTLALFRALEAERSASREAAKSQQIAGFIQQMLGGVDPEVAQGKDTELLRRILDDTALRIEKELRGQPEVEAAIRTTIGETYLALGDFSSAEPHLETAFDIRSRILGKEHADTLASINDMGELLLAQGRLAEAELYYREALQTRRRVLGNEHPDTLISINNMGFLLQRRGKLAEAEPYYREALQTRRRVLGDEHPDTLLSKSNLALLLVDLGQAEEAEELAREAVEVGRRALGPEHWRFGNFLGKDGRSLAALQRFDEAESVLLESHGILIAALGSDHEQTRRVVGYLADLYDDWGKPETAAEWRAKLLVIQDAAAD